MDAPNDRLEWLEPCGERVRDRSPYASGWMACGAPAVFGSYPHLCERHGGKRDERLAAFLSRFYRPRSP